MQNNSFSHPFSKAFREFGKLRRNMRIIASNMAANTFKDNFRRQGFEADGGGIVRWKKRKSNTKKDIGRAILIKTGKLRRGMQPAPDAVYARVINRVAYAKRHNEGFKGIEKVKAHTRYRWKESKVKTGQKTKRGKDKFKTFRSRTHAIRVKAHKRKVDLKARPFMITTKPLLNRINKRIELELKKIFP